MHGCRRMHHVNHDQWAGSQWGTFACLASYRILYWIIKLLQASTPYQTLGLATAWHVRRNDMFLYMATCSSRQ